MTRQTTECVCDFRFYGVGQGLYFVGRVDDLIFVYDCGSRTESRINEAIDMCCQQQKVSKIDLLFLSHLHWDHVSGLERLLGRSKVQRVFLPYLNPWERLVIACSRMALPDWYLSLLRDPVSFLLEQGVEQIVLLSRSTRRDESSSMGRFTDEQTSDIMDQRFYEPRPLRDLDRESRDLIINNELRFNRECRWRRLFDEGILRMSGHFGAEVYKSLWQFVLYNASVDSQKINEFKRLVLNAFPNCVNGSWSDILGSRSCLRKLRECYKSVFRGIKDADGLNSTSLVLWHGPMNGCKLEKSKLEYSLLYGSDTTYALDQIVGEQVFSLVTGLKSQCSGCLLTGDIPLSDQGARDDLTGHLGQLCAATLICLVPHHGSTKNWDEEVVSRFKSCSTWVVSAGLRNSYGHPNKQVVYDLLKSGGRVFWVHEQRGLRIRGNIS